MYLKNGGFCRLIVESTVFRLVFLLFDAFLMCCVSTVTRHLQLTRTQMPLSRWFVFHCDFYAIFVLLAGNLLFRVLCLSSRTRTNKNQMKLIKRDNAQRFLIFFVHFYLTMFRLRCCDQFDLFYSNKNDGFRGAQTLTRLSSEFINWIIRFTFPCYCWFGWSSGCATQCHITSFGDYHISAGRIIQNIRRNWNEKNMERDRSHLVGKRRYSIWFLFSKFVVWSDLWLAPIAFLFHVNGVFSPRRKIRFCVHCSEWNSVHRNSVQSSRTYSQVPHCLPTIYSSTSDLCICYPIPISTV